MTIRQLPPEDGRPERDGPWPRPPCWRTAAVYAGYVLLVAFVLLGGILVGLGVLAYLRLGATG